MGNVLLARHSLETANQRPDEQSREALDCAAFVAQRHRAGESQELQSAQRSALAGSTVGADKVAALRLTLVAKVMGRVDQTSRAHCVRQLCQTLHGVT